MRNVILFFGFFVKCWGFHTIEYLFQRAAGDPRCPFLYLCNNRIRVRKRSTFRIP